jgi:hypothetical protein
MKGAVALAGNDKTGAVWGTEKRHKAKSWCWAFSVKKGKA